GRVAGGVPGGGRRVGGVGARRGVVLGCGGVTGLLSQQAGSAVPPALARAMAALAAKVAASGLAGGGGPANVIALTEGGVMSLFLRKLRQLAPVVLVLGLVSAAAAVGGRQLARPGPTGRGAANTRPQIPDEPRPGVDPGEKPLPEGALARLGTTRFRHVGEVTFAQFTPDGKRLITAG